jgi:hypothetical protein
VLVTIADQLKQAGGSERIQLQVTDFIQDEQLGLGEQRHLLLELVHVPSSREFSDQILHRDEVNAEPVQDGHHPQGNRQVRLARSGWALQNHVLFVFQEAQAGQLRDLFLAVGGLEAEVGLAQTFALRSVT